MNIYVGNLSRQTTEEKLNEAFAAFGAVESVRIVKDAASGESKGFGFVTMPVDDEAQAAITGMNGKDLDGQTIKAEEGRAKTDVPRSRERQGGSRGGYRGGGGGGGGGRRDSRGGGSRDSRGGGRRDSRGDSRGDTRGGGSGLSRRRY